MLAKRNARTREGQEAGPDSCFFFFGAQNTHRGTLNRPFVKKHDHLKSSNLHANFDALLC